MGEWAEWIKEGHFISVLSTVDARLRRYFFVVRREFSHFEYTWEEDIKAGSPSGPYTIDDLENTAKEWAQLWQLIFGIDRQVYIYTHVPTDVDRHGVAKKPKPSAALREVGHYQPWISPWHAPSFVTEHFLVRPDTPFIAVSAYNPETITLKPKLNFFINKLELEKIGEEEAGELRPSEPRFAETLEKLYKRLIPHRPITLMPVRAPATAT